MGFLAVIPDSFWVAKKSTTFTGSAHIKSIKETTRTIFKSFATFQLCLNTLVPSPSFLPLSFWLVTSSTESLLHLRAQLKKRRHTKSLPSIGCASKRGPFLTGTREYHPKWTRGGCSPLEGAAVVPSTAFFHPERCCLPCQVLVSQLVNSTSPSL